MNAQSRTFKLSLLIAISLGIINFALGIHKSREDERKAEEIRQALIADHLEIAAAKHRMRFYDAIVNASNSALVAVDEEGKVLHWNRRAQYIFGWTFAEMKGKSIDILMWPEGLMRHKPALAKAFQYNDPRETQIVKCVGRTKAGNKIDILITAGIIIDDEGKMGVASVKLMQNVRLHGLEEKKEGS